jgi:hypothetical protein
MVIPTALLTVGVRFTHRCITWLTQFAGVVVGLVPLTVKVKLKAKSDETGSTGPSF